MKKLTLSVILFCLVYGTFSQTIFYVKPTASGTGNGSSWANASSDLQAVINAAAAGDDIWVAAGRYVPNRRADNVNTLTPGNRFNAFVLKSGIKLYGGFAGNETSLSGRPVPGRGSANETILSGDFNGNDVITGKGATLSLAGYDENAYHLLVLAGLSNVTVDGLSVSGGSYTGSGGTVQVNGIGVSSALGAGLYLQQCSGIVLNNFAAFHHQGSGAYLTGTNATINHSTFSDNNIVAGGGLYILDDSPIITASEFSYNKASGGGLFIVGNSSPQIDRCIFTGNAAPNSGGGMQVINGATPIISNCLFVLNTAANGGGAILGSHCGPFTISNSTFFGNGAATGKAIRSEFYSGTTKTITLDNCIVYNNNSFSGNDNLSENYGRFQLNSCLLQYTGSGYNINGSWVNQDPQFVDMAALPGPDNKYGTADDGLHLKSNSPAVNRGNKSLLPASLITDLAGNPRVIGNAVDMGALESPYTANVLHVNGTGGNDSNDGLSWTTAFKTIGQALAIAHTTRPEVDSILVGQGTFFVTGLPNPAKPDSTFLITRGHLKLYGGYDPATGTRNVLLQPTIIDGTLNGSTKSKNLLWVTGITGADSVVIDGFTFAHAAGAGIVEEGAVVLKDNTSPGIVVRDCLFTENRGPGAAALKMVNTRALIDRCTFTIMLALGNYSITASNAIFTLSNSVYFENYGSPLNIIDGSQAFLVNTLFAGDNDQGSYQDASSSTTMINCTVSGHAGYAFYNEGTLTVRNSIIMQNSSGIFSGGTADITYSLVQGHSGGTGNLDGTTIYNAGFVDFANNDYRLAPCSPAIDAGNNAYVQAGYDTLADGTPRIKMGTVDLGTYEANSKGSQGGNLPAVFASAMGWQPPSGVVHYGPDCNSLIATVQGLNTMNAIRGITRVKSWVEATQPGLFVKRHVEVTPDDNAATAEGRVTLYFTQAEFDAFNVLNTIQLPAGPGDASGIANLLIEKRGGTSNDGTGLPSSYTGAIETIDPADVDIVWANNRWEVSFHTVGFSGFFVKSQLAALPLNLVSFTGRQVENGNLLQWRTTSEVDTKAFTVERSTNGVDFKVAGTVKAAGSGDNSYSFVDPFTGVGIAWYRLLMTDNDGTYTRSPIISIRSQGGLTVRIFPTVTQDEVHIQSADPVLAGTSLHLVDLNGRTFRREKLQPGNHTLHLKGLPAGIYLLKLVNGGSFKIVKQ